jgi:hypothetical protein
MERLHEEVLNETLETQKDLLQAEKKFEAWRQRKEEEATKEAQQMKEQQYLDEIKRLETHCSRLDLENAELKNKIQIESGNKRITAKQDIEIDQMRALTKKMADNRISDPMYVFLTQIIPIHLTPLFAEINPRQAVTSLL